MKSDERQMLKLCEISESLRGEIAVLGAGSIGRDKAKPYPSPARISPRVTAGNTWFPVQYMGFRVLEFCGNFPEAGGLVLESNLTVHWFSCPRQYVPLSWRWPRLTFVKNSSFPIHRHLRRPPRWKHQTPGCRHIACHIYHPWPLCFCLSCSV